MDSGMLSRAMTICLLGSLVFAVISLGILRGGLYSSLYFHINGTRDACLLGVKQGSAFSNDVCRLGIAVAYIAVTASIAMLCLDGWFRGQLVKAHSRLDCNVPTMVLVTSVAICVLWAASLMFTVWGWIVSYRYFDKHYNLEKSKNKVGLHILTSSLKAAASFYIIFHGFSVLSWSCLALVTRRMMNSSASKGVCTSGDENEKFVADYQAAPTENPGT